VGFQDGDLFAGLRQMQRRRQAAIAAADDGDIRFDVAMKGGTVRRGRRGN
jgi:hypothetical protein